MAQPDPRNDFAGDDYEAEDNKPAETAGEQPHEDPWQYADLEAPNSPPSDATDTSDDVGDEENEEDDE